MYFAKIDLGRLRQRLREIESQQIASCPELWLQVQGFQSADGGWIGPADAMNRLCCDEILFSERAEELAVAH